MHNLGDVIAFVHFKRRNVKWQDAIRKVYTNAMVAAEFGEAFELRLALPTIYGEEQDAGAIIEDPNGDHFIAHMADPLGTIPTPEWDAKAGVWIVGRYLKVAG